MSWGPSKHCKDMLNLSAYTIPHNDLGGVPMKKRRYRATNVKEANWNRIAALATGQRVVCGVDVAKEVFIFMLVEIGVLLLVSYVPFISTFMPRLFGFIR